VRGEIALPLNRVMGSMTFVATAAAIVGNDWDRTCSAAASAWRISPAACFTVGLLAIARRTASSKVSRSTVCAESPPAVTAASTLSVDRMQSVPLRERTLSMVHHLRPTAPASGNQGAHQHIQNRDEDDVQERRKQHPASHCRAD